MSQVVKTNTGEAERSISSRATSTTTVIGARLEQLSQAIKTNSRRSRAVARATRRQPPRHSIRASAQDAERSLTGVSTGVSNVLKQNASDVERTLLGVSAEVARNFVGKADEIARRQRSARPR